MPAWPSGPLQRVYYIYTSYKQNPAFNQKELNRQRIQKLAEQVPEILENRYIEWNIIEQTGCSSPEMGKKFFHGFVLEYQRVASQENREQEIANLEAFLKHPEKGFSMENDPGTSEMKARLAASINSNNREESETTGTSTEANFTDGNLALYQYFKKNLPAGGEVSKNRDDSWVPFSFEVNQEGKISDVRFGEAKPYIQRDIEKLLSEMPNWNPATENGVPVSSRVNLELRMSYSPHVRGMYYRDGKKPIFTQQEVADQTMKELAVDEQTEERIFKVEQSAVYRSMEEVISKGHVAMVMDVTTSMSLHLASMNWWVANSADSLNVVHYTFFNDGDNVDDKKKKSGKTGGIYHGTELRDLPATLLEAMRNGNGGDIVENDFEAVLAAQKEQAGANTLLLIVDNFSDVRDEHLLAQIQMKTHVLLAGDVTTVRECYLNLAKATGGDVFVNGKRINLGNVRKGGRINIAEATYIYDGQVFKLL
ncbi:MAG: hypothetical protein ACFHU9_13365 [Fluviicola sp.]